MMKEGFELDLNRSRPFKFIKFGPGITYYNGHTFDFLLNPLFLETPTV